MGRIQPLEEILQRVTKFKGEKHWNWKGGITPLMLNIRHCLEYRQWVKRVFERDNYICKICKKRGGKLEAHHIKSFSIIISSNIINSLAKALVCKELWEISNGQTLCKNCHKQLEKTRKNLMQQGDNYDIFRKNPRPFWGSQSD